MEDVTFVERSSPQRLESQKQKRVSGALANATHQTRKHLKLIVGVVIVATIIVGAALAPRIAPADPTSQDLAHRLKGPAWFGAQDSLYPLGSDGFGRDVLSRVVYGARVSLLVAAAAIAISGFSGTLLGLIAGYYEGILETVIMRVADMQLALPSILLAVMVVAIFGASLVNLVIVLAISGWVTYTRIVYNQVRSLKQTEFVTSARAVGATNARILRRHIFPNTRNSIIVISTLQVGQMILLEAALSFLGLGVPPPTPSWGSMLAEGRNVLAVASWLATIPGLAIVITVLGINFLGDGLRELLDPKRTSD